jgi:hypothetical protein
MIAWLFEHAGRTGTYVLVLLLAAAVFAAWLAAPVTWRGAEGTLEDDGKRFATWVRRLWWWM